MAGVGESIVGLTKNQVGRRIHSMRRKRAKLSDQLRRIIDGCDKSRYQISQETGIDQATLSRFMHGQGGLSMDGLDRIAECLGLNFTTGEKPWKRKGR